MRVAICLSGEPRDVNYIFGDFLDKLNINNPDIFVHTWHSNINVSELPVHMERGGAYYQNLLTTMPTSEYINTIGPMDFLVENYYKSDPYLRFKTYKIPSNITRMYSMFYGIQAVSELVNQNNYDFIIRTRPDLYLENKINWLGIADFLEKNPEFIMVPDLWVNIGGLTQHWSANLEQCPDFFCIYKAGSTLFEGIYDSIANFCGLHMDRSIQDMGNLPSLPEDYLAAFIKSKNMKIKVMDMKMMLARHHKQVIEGRPIF